MSKLYIIKDGIKGVGCIVDKEGNQKFGESFYLISADFINNYGYIQLKSKYGWRLYTTIKSQQSPYRGHFENFAECAVKLQYLCYPTEVQIIDSTDVPNIDLKNQ